MSEREWERERVGEGGRGWESEIVRVRKPLWTAKEPALVFYVYAQKSLFIGENGNAFFGQQHLHPCL